MPLNFVDAELSLVTGAIVKIDVQYDVETVNSTINYTFVKTSSHTTSEETAWGSPFSFKYDERRADPRNSKHHEENIYVAEIDDMQGYHETVRAQEINNELLSWGCQQWVLEALKSLNDSGIISDYAHAEAKEKLNLIFGEEADD
ncbi:hypothetical protein AJ79_09219 [Helicocarpus griseus UAMH5409]|uniref:Uncharacterized protein n=1 Tax=Helicocarpus griseus UAMH5409 TaxID=1447875 RepID=A0A2B7WLM3_9EURO|nr:hypothetical protein AJ79_09219 [Helicocarpus griseus UAMH5409]